MKAEEITSSLPHILVLQVKKEDYWSQEQIFVCVCVYARSCMYVCTDISAFAFAGECEGQRLTMGCLPQSPTLWIKVSHWTGNLMFFATQPGRLVLRILLFRPSPVLKLQAFSSMLGFSVGAVGCNSGPPACAESPLPQSHLPDPYF